MQIFTSETDFLCAVAEHDELVRRCVCGDISLSEFKTLYNSFYASHALDGHESDVEERAVFAKHAALIEPHRIITFEILGNLCTDEDAELRAFKEAGRFDGVHALRLLKRIQIGASSKIKR
jgi:hypothetical protein